MGVNECFFFINFLLHSSEPFYGKSKASHLALGGKKNDGQFIRKDVSENPTRSSRIPQIFFFLFLQRSIKS